MIHELSRHQSDKARPLCQALAHFPFCTAVLASVHPGRVFVDCPVDPGSTFVVHDDGCCFLAGDADNGAFNQAVSRLICEALADRSGAFFACHPEDWGGQLPAVFAPQTPIPRRRRHYVGRELQFDWRAAVPDGFAVMRLEPALLERPGLQVPKPLQETLAAWLGFERLQDHLLRHRPSPTAPSPTTQCPLWLLIRRPSPPSSTQGIAAQCTPTCQPASQQA